MKKMPATGREPKKAGRTEKDCVDIQPYVANETPCCLAAYENIKKICDEYAGGKKRITVIDLLKKPEIAQRDEITAIPTLVLVPRTAGRRKIIGILSDTRKVLEELDLPEKASYQIGAPAG
jgi:circadian clock protein KaiB